MSVDTLTVIESSERRTSEGDTFIIEDELANADTKVYSDGYRTVAEAGRGTSRSAPLLSLYWPHLANPQKSLVKGNEDTACLTFQLILYERLVEQIESVEPSTIRCQDVPEAYRATITDAAEATGVTISDPYTHSTCETFFRDCHPLPPAFRSSTLLDAGSFRGRAVG